MAEDLAIELQPRGAAAGVVVLQNRGPSPVRVWRTGNRWGDVTLSFEISSRRVVRRPQEYTRNVPASAELPPGGSYALPFDLDDGSWDANGPVHELLRPGAELVAVHEVEPTPEAATHGVSTGTLRSEPVRLEE